MHVNLIIHIDTAIVIIINNVVRVNTDSFYGRALPVIIDDKQLST
jgi:hypothetical protein